MGKKVSINVDQTNDNCFSIELSKGFLDKKRVVAETVDSLVQKTSVFLRSEFAGDKTGLGILQEQVFESYLAG